MTSINVRPSILLLLCILPCLTLADGKTEFGGHTKLRLVGQTYPSGSLFRDQFGSHSLDGIAELRLNVEHRQHGWMFVGDYQFLALDGETIRVPDDQRRLFDLTSSLDQGRGSALLHRLDRLWIGYSSEHAVVRFGRQALSWGNGLFYAPMDLVNPFDPAAVDTEYKAGDDMLYAQYVQNTGADIQVAYVIRRDPLSGDVDSRFSTAAVKYHGFLGAGEYDVLLANHYDDLVAGISSSRALGGATLSGDFVVTDTEENIVVQATLNLSYSWIAFEKNMSGSFEYHFNGFGQFPSRYDPASLAGNPDLVRRLVGGESFAAGRHYIAGSVLVEVTPLWTVSPTLLLNVGDPSGLLQLTTTYSLSDSKSLLASIGLPLGPDGTEFGGAASAVQSRYLSSDANVFAQFAWYF